MHDDDEYEIMPVDEIEKLKQEIKELKKNSPDSGLASSIDTLNQNIKDLLDVFKEATKDIREEEEKVDDTKQKIDELSSNVTELFDQNAKIAEGIINIHDDIEEMKMQLEKPGTGHADIGHDNFSDNPEAPGHDAPPFTPQRPGPLPSQGSSSRAMPPPPPGPMPGQQASPGSSAPSSRPMGAETPIKPPQKKKRKGFFV